MGDPVYRKADGWYHADEVWADEYGPYPDRYIAELSLAMYCFLVLGGGEDY